jgi:CDP-4-dehydro-6-deoxyglucose reductase, E3
MAIVTLSSGAVFEAESGMSLLDAAAKVGVTIPYSCKTGRCSTCRSKVLSGVTTALYPESGLTDEEMSAGWILSCVRSAETDVVVEVDDLGDVVLPVSKTLPCRISQLTYLSPNVIQVLLRLPQTAQFNFIPGQYIEVIGQNGIRRSYSLASANFADKTLEIHIRAVDGGMMSQYWFNQAKINDLLRLEGPFGTFFLRDTTNVDLVFLATGTGIAPIKAILESLAHRPVQQHPKSVTVLWGGRTPQDFYMDLTGMVGAHTYVPVQSRPNEDWSGARGYVQDVLVQLMADFENATVYACGSDAMIHSARDRLTQAGLPAKRFYSDAFVCSGVK